jgi:hypothetical protein
MQSALSVGVRAAKLAGSSFATSSLCFATRLCLPDLCLAAEDDLCFAPTEAFFDSADERCFAATGDIADMDSTPVKASRQTAVIKPTPCGIMVLSPLITPHPRS